MSRPLASLVCSLLLAGPTLADPESGPAETPDAPLLRGPAVPEDATDTLVEQTMSGEFVRVEGRPEIAAIQLLHLDDDTLERALEIADQRVVDLAGLLVDEIDTVREITDHTAVGDDEQARHLLRGLWSAFDEDQERDPLSDPLVELLSPEQAEQYRSVLDEYWNAWITWETRRAEHPTAKMRERAEQRLAFRLFQTETREAYDLSLRRYKEVLDAIYDAVDPTDEERETIRTIVIDHVKETRLRATPEQRRAAMVEIYRELDAEKQERLFGYLLRQIIPGE